MAAGSVACCGTVQQHELLVLPNYKYDTTPPFQYDPNAHFRANDNYAITGLRCGEIIIKDHYWNCPGTELAGNAIDFIMRIRGATFHEAMQQLTQPKRS